MSVNHIYAIALSVPLSSSPSDDDDDDDDNQPYWALSLQPKKQQRQFFHSHTSTSIFHGTYGSGSSDGSTTTSTNINNQTLLVKLLIGEPASSPSQSIETQITTALGTVIKTSNSETWLKDAVNTLQHHKLVQAFDVDGFMKVATETLHKQQRHPENVAVEVDFLAELNRTTGSVGRIQEAGDTALEKGSRKGEGSRHFGFWISRPRGFERKVRRVNSWERQDDAYGGLM